MTEERYDKKSMSVGTAMAIGAAIGAAIVVLTDRRKRDEILDKLQDMRSKTQKTAGKVQDKASEILDRGHEVLETTRNQTRKRPTRNRT